MLSSRLVGHWTMILRELSRNIITGTSTLNDIALGEVGLNRLENVVIPNECYGEILEHKVLPWLEEISQERSSRGDSAWNGFGTVELCWAIGDRIEDDSSILHWVAKNRIPVVILELQTDQLVLSCSSTDKGTHLS